MIHSTAIALLLSIFLLDWAFSGAALAQTQAGNHQGGSGIEQTKTIAQSGKHYQDWILKCGDGGLRDDQCFIMQNVFIQGTGLRLLGVAAGYLGENDSPRLFFTLPLGTFLPAGMAFRIDAGRTMEMPIRICVADGCKSSINLDERLIRALMQGSQVKVAFLRAESRRQVTVQVSLTGFSRAFGALTPRKP